ncbi:MAG: HD domain-containing phosphohydrolase [Thermodesulfobacteriota bacterium]
MIKNRSLHLMLITRLAAVTLIVSVLVAILVVGKERERVFQKAREKALMRTGMLRMLILENLDAPNLGSHEAIRKMVKSMAYQGSDLDVGRYVFARIIDASFTEVARVVNENHDQINDLVQYIESGQHRIPAGVSRPEMTWVRVGSRRYVYAMVPFANSRGDIAAYVEGFYASTEQEDRAAFRNLLQALAIAIGTVLATSLLLYPLIVQLLRRVERLSLRLLDANMEMLRVIGSTIAKRDSDTDIHNFRVTIYAVRIAEAMGLDASMIRTLIKGAFLHDVGKIGIRDNILLKPGKLDENEFTEMKKHVHHGRDIINRSSWLKDALPVVESHHEKFEGQGYPDGLIGTDIPILARIFAIADVFDALTSHRPYKSPLSFEDTIDILIKGRTIHFDPEVLDVFIGIAKPLYDTYGNRDDDTPRYDLDEIVKRYFRADIAAYLD